MTACPCMSFICMHACMSLISFLFHVHSRPSKWRSRLERNALNWNLGLWVIFRCTWCWAYTMLVLFHDISHTELTRYWMQGKTLLTTSSKDFWDGNKGSHWNPKQFIIEITSSRVSHYNQSCKHAQSWILIQVTISMGKLMTSRSLRSAPFTKQVCSSLNYIPNTWQWTTG